MQGSENLEDPLVFVSKVTEIVAFKRMTHDDDGTYSIFVSSGGSSSDSDEDDDEGADEWV